MATAPANAMVTAAASTAATSPALAKRATPSTYTISVGALQYGNQYYPQSLNNVKVGDMVTFEFYPSNHSVVRAAYGVPCQPYENIVKGGKGFFSEPMLVANNFEKPSWNLTVFSTEPIFFYCTAIGSCIKEGMVGAINPNSTQTLGAQVVAAHQAPYMLMPGQSPPAEGSEGGAAPSSSPSPTGTPSGGSHLTGGAIAGIVVGILAGLALIGALFFLLGRNKVYAKWVASEKGVATTRTEAWLSGAKPGPWSSDMGSSRAPEDAASPPHMSMVGSPHVGMDPGWRGSPPPPSSMQHGWSMYGSPHGWPGHQQQQQSQFMSQAPVNEVHEVYSGDPLTKSSAAVAEMSADRHR